MKPLHTSHIATDSLAALDKARQGSRSAAINQALRKLVRAPEEVIPHALAYRLTHTNINPQMSKISATIEVSTAQALAELAGQLQLSINDLTRIAIDAAIHRKRIKNEPIDPVPAVQGEPTAD